MVGDKLDISVVIWMIKSKRIESNFLELNPMKCMSKYSQFSYDYTIYTHKDSLILAYRAISISIQIATITVQLLSYRHI